jgi:hypothetical protein
MNVVSIVVLSNESEKIYRCSIHLVFTQFDLSMFFLVIGERNKSTPLPAGTLLPHFF